MKVQNSLRAEETLAFGFWNSLRDYETSRVHSVLVWAALLYAAFGLLDWFAYRELVGLFWPIRASFVFLCVFLVRAVKRCKTYRAVVVVSLIAFLCAGWGISLMCLLAEGFTSPYYAGLILCFLFAAALFTWPLWVAGSAFLLVLLPQGGQLVLGARNTDPRLAYLYGGFLVSSVLLSLVGMSVRNRLALRAYLRGQELSRRNRELADLHALKDRMFQNVSHELRTPLTLILTPLQQKLSANEELSTAERSWMEELHRNGMRLLKQVNDLLDLARLDSNGMSLDRRPVEVISLLKDLLADARMYAEAAGIEISLTVPERPVVYALDPVHLERVVLNLLSNALKFTPRGGHIGVLVKESETGLTLEVKDTGFGISREDQAHIFERFRQGDEKTTRRFGGSGIGLALVAELSRLMGGSVKVASEVERGSRFVVSFPADLAVSSACENGQVAAPSEAHGLHRQADRESLKIEKQSHGRLVAGVRGPRVLVAEDDEHLRRQLIEILSPTHRVVAVGTGDEALREALVFRPQVVVSDVMMPGIDGVELCHRLRERFDLRDTAIILLTAKGHLEERVEGRRAGADSYLTKPFEVQELLATIEGLLRSRMHLVGDYLVHGSLGRGGQSDVRLAEHRKSGIRVALKLFRSDGLEDATVRRRLRREHAALAQLDHPNIVNVVDEGEEASGLYVAMEYLEGVTLDALVRERGALEPSAAASIGATIADALACVHSARLLHRDVKCSNLMLLQGEGSVAERVRLIDFGTAAPLQASGTRTSRLFGSLHYLAPELLRGEAEASPATDVYGLGVVLYRLVSGNLPFRGETPHELLESMAGEPTVILSDVPGVSLPFARLIEATMAKDSWVQRPTAATLRLSLDSFADTSIAIPVVPQPQSSLVTATVQPSRDSSTTSER